MSVCASTRAVRRAAGTAYRASCSSERASANVWPRANSAAADRPASGRGWAAVSAARGESAGGSTSALRRCARA
jgi:hypothetical protein